MATYPHIDAGERLCLAYLQGKCSSKTCQRAHEEPQWRQLLPSVPRDDEDPNYALSFDFEGTEWLPFLEAHSYVVLRGIVPAEDCDGVVAEFQDRVNELRGAAGIAGPAIDFQQPSAEAWETENWPMRSKFLVNEPALGPRAFAARTLPQVHAVWSRIFGTDKLWSSVDALGIMRATRALPHADGTFADRLDWEVSLPPHWDCSPWEYTRELAKGYPRKYQGLVALVDTPEEVGGFCVVPGMARHLPLWLAKVPEPAQPVHSYHPSDKAVTDRMQRVPLRKGDLVIWDNGCTHANFRNTSSEAMRLALYLRYMPADPLSARRDSRAPNLMLEQYGHLLPPDVFADLSPRARRLLSLDKYS